VSQLDVAQLTALLAARLPACDQHGEVIEDIAPEHVRLRLAIASRHLSLPPGAPHAVCSGPLMLGVADTAMYACVHACYGADVFAAMVNFNVAFMRVAGDADLLAIARLVRRGTRLAFLDTHLYSGALTAPCAQVTATYAVRSV
jgi:acyl-coenzyme A thioesterase PaaI-like protein